MVAKKYKISTYRSIVGDGGLAEIAEKEPLAGDKKDKKSDAESQKNDAEKQGCTALRIAAGNNQQLIVQTDKKAHVLVQVNALMISVLLAFALNIPEKHPLVIMPIVVQMITSLAVIVSSLAVTRPKRGGALHRTSYYSGADNNLLFFETYTGMDQEEYVQEMEYMFGDAGQIYQNLIQESYHQARMLGKKYKYLHLAYLLFSVGTGVSIITSIIVAFF